MSPTHRIAGCEKLPPFLMLQGDADPVVPYAQCEKMYHMLYDAGAEVRMVRVEGAPHERSFWSRELLDIIAAFIDSKITVKQKSFFDINEQNDECRRKRYVSWKEYCKI